MLILDAHLKTVFVIVWIFCAVNHPHFRICSSFGISFADVELQVVVIALCGKALHQCSLLFLVMFLTRRVSGGGKDAPP